MTIGEIIKAIAGVILIIGFILVLLCNAMWSIDDYKKRHEEEKKNNENNS